MSTGPPNRSPRHRNRRREGLALLLSFLVHLLAALLFLIWPFERERLGSEELDIELVAPRLAPPIRALGVDLPGRARSARGETRDRRGLKGGDGHARQASRQTRPGARSASSPSLPPWLLPLPAQQKPQAPRTAERRHEGHEARRSQGRCSPEQEAPASRVAASRGGAEEEEKNTDAPRHREREEKQERQKKRGQKGLRSEHEQGEARVRKQAPRGEAGQEDEEREEQRARRPEDQEARDAREASTIKERSKKRARREREPKLAVMTAASGSALFRIRPSTRRAHRRATARLAMLPEGPSLSALVDSVRQDARMREQARRRALHRSRVRQAAADAALSAVKRRTAQAARSRGRGGPGADAAGQGHRLGAAGKAGGRSHTLGMKFYLSGRRVKTSRVVRPPELIKVPKIKCKVTHPGVTPATVRMLVETGGEVGHLYLKHSSGSKRFDRCALSHTRRMFFKPGTDQAGTPLNVWINVRVEPSLIAGR